ncbi:TVP38/TMEM64 family protein [Bacillus spongiae]|uniref:TVP38/TMEM64 family membrane protein n=1 Tax=Bacillus spongiae TaxID=2683610 RepID=A0ABU8HB71_9BACI
MDMQLVKEWLTLDNIMQLIQHYRSFGPIAGILLPMIEAFFPFLPLFLFVLANANAFGLWWGFLFSWIGASLGAFIVFLIVRKYGQKKILRFLQRHQKVQRLMNWIEDHGFGPLFLLLCFPFTPSAVVNIVAGLSRMNIYQYMLAVLTGKMVMIFIISYIGYDLRALITQPTKTGLALGIIFILWLVGKRLEVRLNQKIKEHQRR